MHDLRVASLPLVIRCKACGYELRYDHNQVGFTWFARRVKWMTPFSAYVHRLKCGKCGKREAEIGA